MAVLSVMASVETGTLNRRPPDGLPRQKVRKIAYLIRNILFFPLAAAVFGGKAADYIREPDFVICQDGKWGILEVMGDWYHTSSTAVKDHERGRLFNDHRIHC